MKIGMILEAPFPPDIRVEKEMLALKKGNHELFLLCLAKENQLTEDKFPLATIVRLADNSKRSKIHRMGEIVYQWITTRSKKWEAAVTRFIEDNKIDAIHVHDLPLASTCIWAAKKAGISSVVDLHEIYPEMVRFTLSSANDIPLSRMHRFQFALQSPEWWEKVEHSVAQNADRVVVVIDESKQRLVESGIDEEKIFIVMNATDIEEFLHQSSTVEAVKKSGFTCCYVGGVENPNRGLHNLVNAWPIVLKAIPEASLWIVGDGGVRPILEELVRSSNLQESIKFTGKVPFSSVSAYIKAADVTIIPHVINEHTNNTIPHKLFQYIALGKIVVASDIKPIKRILQDTQAGVIATEWSPQGFADAIGRAHNLLKSGAHNPATQVQLLRQKYDFLTIQENLISLYKSLEE